MHTITAESGGEICKYEIVAERLDTDIYSANPHASLVLGANENFNGLLRQRIRKWTDAWSGNRQVVSLNRKSNQFTAEKMFRVYAINLSV